MADALFELLAPHLNPEGHAVPAKAQATSDYLDRLTTLSLEGISSTEPDSLDYETQTIARSLQALAKRSYKSIDASTYSLGQLNTTLPQVSSISKAIDIKLPELESHAVQFAEKYAHASENPRLERRRRAARLSDNADRLSDILELPALLSSTITASTAPSTSSSVPSPANSNYTAALDLYAHIKRVHKLYPQSTLMASISRQAEDAMRAMTSSLIASLRSQSLKLAGAMRLIGLLRRVAPELDDTASAGKVVASSQSEGSLGALFLICRLVNLNATLEALEPLRDLADQETETIKSDRSTVRSNAWVAGQQTERYLKRHIEIFREQCFAIVSMYKNIFPASLPGPSANKPANASSESFPTPLGSLGRGSSFQKSMEQQSQLLEDPAQQIPPALATFTMHIVESLLRTLRTYLPNVQDQSSRDSLLTQVLYCATSLGKLGGDFGLMLSLLEEEMEDDLREEMRAEHGKTNTNTPEWVEIMQKHRIQAGRLELLASGIGRDRPLAARDS